MKSEVSALLAQINDEYFAACQGLHGYAEVARHAAINARMERVEDARQQLISVVGNEHDAMALIIQAIDKTSTGDEKP